MTRLNRRMTTEQFIVKAKLVHGDKYDYKDTVYVLSREKLQIKCHVHGDFSLQANNHLNGQGCKRCGIEAQHVIQRKTLEQFISDAREVHEGKYDYSLTHYRNSSTKIDIICNIHGVFSMSPNNHLMNKGCPVCGVVKRSNNHKITFKEFVQRARAVHGESYTYNESSYRGSKNKTDIMCKKHGVFSQQAFSHMSGTKCRKCQIDAVSGENNYNYKGGVGRHDPARNVPEYNKWVASIKYNQPYCDTCGALFTKDLSKHAHHLNSWMDHPEQRFLLENGVCICEVCHNDFHSKYGYGGNTKIQYEDFKNVH